jgi:hypothetical protein
MQTIVERVSATLALALTLGACGETSPTESEGRVGRDDMAASSVEHRWSVVSGLDNPRGLAFGPDGQLYVAEAGTGGTTSTLGQCAQEPPPIGPFTGGLTGRISRVTSDGVRHTVASGLPSATGAFGDIVGVSGVAFLQGRLYALVAGGGCSHGHVSDPAGIYQVTGGGAWSPVADFTPFYLAHPAANPDPPSFSPDASLYGIATRGDRLYFTEANQRGLFEWRPGHGFGRVADLSVVEGYDVPAALSLDGSLLVSDFGQLRGPTIGVGTESVYRVGGSGRVSEWATGFTKILGLAEHRGSLYVLEAASTEIFAPGSGRVVRVRQRGLGSRSEVVTGLYFPTAMIIGPDGALYVSNRGFGAAPGIGEVLRIPL